MTEYMQTHATSKHSTNLTGITQRYLRGPAIALLLLLLNLPGEGLAQSDPGETPDNAGPVTMPDAAPRSFPDNTINRQWLQQQLSPGETVWLDGEQKTLALFRRSDKDRIHGSVMLLPYRSQHAAWPGPLRELYHYLPLHGWNTLAISMTGIPSATGTAADAEDNSASGSADAESGKGANGDGETDDQAITRFDDTAAPATADAMGEQTDSASSQDATLARLDAARDFIARQEQSGKPRRILLVQGAGCMPGLSFAARTGNNISGIILLDAVAECHAMIITQLKEQRFKMLEILSASDLQAREAAQLRRQQTGPLRDKAGKLVYEQLALNQGADTDDALLAKRVRGWLKKQFLDP